MALADRSWAHMGAGFLLMGSWAVFANRAHPMPAPLLAGLLQGVLTATITLGLKHVQEFLVARLPGWPGWIAPPVATCLISFTLLFTLHSLARTPEVLATLAVPTSVATLYAVAYTTRLKRRP